MVKHLLLISIPRFRGTSSFCSNLRRALGQISLQDYRYSGHFGHVLDVLAIFLSQLEELEVFFFVARLGVGADREFWIGSCAMKRSFRGWAVLGRRRRHA